MKTIIFIFLMLSISGCSVYKSYGRKEFESKSPSIVRTLNKAQSECWTQPEVTEINPIDIKTHQLLQQTENQELWQNREQNVLTEIEVLTENLFSVCQQKISSRP